MQQPTVGNLHLNESYVSIKDVEIADKAGGGSDVQQHKDAGSTKSKQSWFDISAITEYLTTELEMTSEEREEEAKCKLPDLSYLQLFVKFLSFGCRAFGGPVAQIATMKNELVDEEKWVSIKRFNRVYSVYQILPGPEATELACYFGYLIKGRIGAVIAGLGFLIPGVGLMLLWSYVYVTFGLTSLVVQRSFSAMQMTISACIFRSTYKLADGALMEKDPADPKKTVFNWDKFFICLFCFLTSTIYLNFFISLAVAGIMNTLFKRSEDAHVAKDERTSFVLRFSAFFIAASTIGFYVLYTQYEGVPTGSLIGGSIGDGSDSSSYSSLLVLGLIAGCVTFGGAYTTIPFIYTQCVQSGGWLTQKQFLDALAITNMMPTPLVTFVAMIGFIGNGIGGAILITIGIFVPAFSFTIIGHNIFEKVVDNKLVQPFLDGISSAVIGLLIVVSFQFFATVATTPIDAIIFFLSFSAVFHFSHKFTMPVVIIVAAIAGQSVY